jgi:uncharacterized protein (DUF1778 family)
MAKKQDTVTFAVYPSLVELIDDAAQREMLSRSAWLRRVAAQTASARIREPELVAGV